MAQKRVRPASPCQAATGLGNLLSSPDRKAEYNPSLHAGQSSFDVVSLIAARSGVHPATVAAHLAVFGIGGAHG